MRMLLHSHPPPMLQELLLLLLVLPQRIYLLNFCAASGEACRKSCRCAYTRAFDSLVNSSLSVAITPHGQIPARIANTKRYSYASIINMHHVNCTCCTRIESNTFVLFRITLELWVVWSLIFLKSSELIMTPLLRAMANAAAFL